MTYEDILKKWQEYNLNSIDKLEIILDNFRIIFAYHSAKIENNEVTFNDTREIFKYGKILTSIKNPRTIFEMQNQKLCYEFLKDKIVNKDKITIDLIKEVHLTLTQGTYDEQRYIINNERPGTFKKHDYITGINEVGSLAENVESDLIDLLNEVNDYQGNDCLKVATYFHLKFEYIHPFADGNGRIGRTLMNYYLMINNYPPIVINEENRNEYYQCLQTYDESEEITPMNQFLKLASIDTWERTMNEKTRIKMKKTLNFFL